MLMSENNNKSIKLYPLSPATIEKCLALTITVINSSLQTLNTVNNNFIWTCLAEGYFTKPVSNNKTMCEKDKVLDPVQCFNVQTVWVLELSGTAVM